MTTDARNSIYLWVGGLAFFGLFWAVLHFELLWWVSDKWLWPTVGIILAVNLAQSFWGFWKRRASNARSTDRL